MCGILGVVSVGRMEPSVASRVAVWSERMTPRGPDGSGLSTFAGAAGGVGGAWSAVLAHRRLAVIETGPAGAQPMVSPCGRWAIIYNGELYNDAELRAELVGRWQFRTRSDTETVLAAVATWGMDAGKRLRGMYAIAALELGSGRLVLGRDPMGIKPLFVSERVDAVCFSSDVRTVAEWAGEGVARPDYEGAAAYMTTIRTTLGNRTMYEGAQTLMPGEWREYRPAGRVGECLARRVTRIAPGEVEVEGGEVRAVVEASIVKHLRSDVPICCLLSGGLDSTIVAAIAKKHLGELHTYCAGAKTNGRGGDGEDFEYAARAAAAIGTTHTEVGITRELFARRVPAMIGAIGVPLSTPNEIAIHEVARAMRADGKVVTLSGEGADELFGGYDQVLAAAATHEAALDGVDASLEDRAAHAAEFWCGGHAWIGQDLLARVLTPESWALARGGVGTRGYIESAFEEILRKGLPNGNGGLEAHLRYQRTVNLEGLLRRLDTATMLASVEGRTPLADAAVCAVAESLPTASKIELAAAGPANSLASAYAAGAPKQSKIALRRAFANVAPAEIFHRRKASFPLPFETWIEDLAPRMRESKFLGEMVRPEVVEAVASAPQQHWRLAWPMANLAIWGETLTGKPSAGHAEAGKAQGFIEASLVSAAPETL